MFLFNFFEVCHFLCKKNKNIIQVSPLNQWNKKYTWFSRKIFVLYRKWKIKSVAVLDVQVAAHLEAFGIKQSVLSLHISVLGMWRGIHMRLHISYAKACFCSSKLVHFFKFSFREIYFSNKFWEHQFFSIVNVWHSFTY